MSENIEIFEGEPNKNYTNIKVVKITIKRLTVFDTAPSKEEIFTRLKRQALSLGADAIINIKYDYGFGFINWGYINVKGICVKFRE